MLQIYSNQISPRLRYICNFLLKEMMRLDFEFNNDFDSFKIFNGNKINYSAVEYKNIPSIKPVELLFENEIHPLQTDCVVLDETKMFFRSENENFFPFDLFAASFYLLSRYEEYLPFKADKHGRFPAVESLAFKEKFLNQPIIDLWLEKFKKYLLQFYPDLKFKEHKFKFISTIDVDNGYAYKGKSLFKTTGGLAKVALKGDIYQFVERIKVLSGIEKDPFDWYEYQKLIMEKYQLEMIYFLLCGKQGINDHNILSGSNEFKEMVGFLKSFAEIGLHPSYASDSKVERVKEEKNTLENVIDAPVNKSRQHFLKMSLPETYNNLIAVGIKKDYSMGYASHPGFRAGISRPFKWYNLREEKEMDLLIYPFQVMDVTFMDYLQIAPEESLNQIKLMLKSVKSVNGLLISIWHDRTFAKKGWTKVYLNMIEEVMNR